jgi:hypothetical protein
MQMTDWLSVPSIEPQGATGVDVQHMTGFAYVSFPSWLYEANSQYHIGIVNKELRRGRQVPDTSKADSSGDSNVNLEMIRIGFGCFLNATRGV